YDSSIILSCFDAQDKCRVSKLCCVPIHLTRRDRAMHMDREQDRFASRRGFLRNIAALSAASISAAATAAPATVADGESPHERLLSRYLTHRAKFDAAPLDYDNAEAAAFADGQAAIFREALAIPIKSARDL